MVSLRFNVSFYEIDGLILRYGWFHVLHLFCVRVGKSYLERTRLQPYEEYQAFCEYVEAAFE